MEMAGHGWSIPVRATGVTHARQPADTEVMGVDNVDRRLVRLFEASQAHERARRELLPPEWLNADRAPADHLGEVFDQLVERAREYVRDQRDAADRQERERQSQA
jgi:hypothetical protein